VVYALVLTVVLKFLIVIGELKVVFLTQLGAIVQSVPFKA